MWKCVYNLTRTTGGSASPQMCHQHNYPKHCQARDACGTLTPRRHRQALQRCNGGCPAGALARYAPSSHSLGWGSNQPTSRMYYLNDVMDQSLNAGMILSHMSYLGQVSPSVAPSTVAATGRFAVCVFCCVCVRQHAPRWQSNVARSCTCCWYG